MKPWTVLLLGVLLAAGASALTAALVPSGSSRRGEPSSADVERTLSELAGKVEDLQAQNAQLEERLAALQRLSEEAASTPAASRTELGGLDAAVARWMDANTDRLEDLALSAAPAGAALSNGSQESIDSILDVFLSDELDEIQEQALWDRLRKEGRLDEVVAALEALVAERPHDPDLQTELGNAYIQKIFDVGMGPMAGVFGEKADEAYDRALEIDPEHWEARFSKAVSLSNWPAFLGKTGEAIHQFETLITQQENRSPEDHYEQTYYFLGNMYLQTGETAKALEAWRRGIAVFPDSEMLLGQIALYGSETER